MEHQRKYLENQVAEKTKEIRDTQAQLVQSEKMAALGKLTAGIAHEMNTPIGAIRSTVDVLSRSSAKLEQILENSETLAEVNNGTAVPTLYSGTPVGRRIRGAPASESL